MSIAEERINKTQSEAFLSIRKKIQSQMKKQNVTYSDILESIKKDEEKTIFNHNDEDYEAIKEGWFR